MSENSDLNVVGAGNDLGIASQTTTSEFQALLTNGQYWYLVEGGPGSANFEGAWNYATGKGVLVGIIDQGVNYTHLDLAGHYAQGLDFDPRDASGSDAMPDDQSQQHGTKVAGVIVGSHDNTIGTIGAAPDATITASYLRFGAGVDMPELVSVLAQASRYDVANNSWGFTQAFSDNFHSTTFADFAAALEHAADSGRGGLGTAIVVAAGNGRFSVGGVNQGDDSNFHNFSNSRFVIAVGASDPNGDSAAFSSPGTNVLISAPGVGLMTTAGNDLGSNGSAYASGTSFAAPMVASAIALMLEVNPGLGYRDIQEILAITAKPSDSAGASENGAANINGGGLVFDREMGFGTLDAEAAVKLARHWSAQSTAATEQHLSGNFALPASSSGLSQSFHVNIANPGTAGFSTGFVALSLTLTDANLANLSIDLVSPDGTHSLIAPNLKIAGSATTLDFTFSTVASWGENPYGMWTLNLVHPSDAGGFSVSAAKLDVYGDATDNNDTFYVTSAFESLVAKDPHRSTIVDVNGGSDMLNFAAAKGTLVLDLSGVGASKFGSTAIHLDGSIESAVGTSSADAIAGSELANTLNGSFGDDVLTGRGGDDTLTGDAGNDVLNGGAGADRLVGGAGIDTADYSLAGGPIVLDLANGIQTGEAQGDTFDSIEQFRLTGFDDRFIALPSDASSHTLFGDAGNDVLLGGLGSDWLDGGSGIDDMRGGGGDDVYVIDSALDSVTELDGGGYDTIVSSVNITRPTNVEKLVLAGGAALRVVANSLNNWITGNDGSNVLDGGAGIDRLIGGRGNDTYRVDSSGDIVTEKSAQGTDTVRSTANFRLSANVENLRLDGHAALKGVGNGLANTITGNDRANQIDGLAGNDRLYGNNGNDRLDGGTGNDRLFGGRGNDTLSGGKGHDVLSGNAGRDVFVFATSPHSAGRDVISDFNHAQDTIRLDHHAFAAIGRGALDPGYFRVGPSALDANDHIIYDRSTGVLSYDANGNAAGGVTELAILTHTPLLAANDFVVI
jgi:Ca2+-binding RTX toxin-like protein/subtilisin family serine protease